MALHHKEIEHNSERISLVQYYEYQYNCDDLEFSLTIQISKFEKNNPGIAVNALFNKEGTYIACRSGLNGECKRQVNLLMVVDGERRHYTAITNISRLLSRLNRKSYRAYHCSLNCLNGFQTSSARDKHCKYCSTNGHVRVKMPTESEKWLKFHDG